MKSQRFSKKPLAAAISLALSSHAVLAQEGPAQTTEGQDGSVLEEVVVSGIRSSLKKSMDRKRFADGVVDAITAEDIGDFPDSNLAESLQRITGVSIDRERGEGSKVTVRGFGPAFNLVLLNGRQLPTTDGINRSFDFAKLASESVSAVEVYKSGKADVPSGGIGSTINIRTTRPLESPGMKFTAAVSGVHDESTEEGSSFTPEISALFSNTFADDTIGVAISAVRQERESGAQTASVGGWRTFPGVVNNSWGSGVGVQEWGGIPIAGDPNQQNRPGDDDIYSVPQTIGYELAEYEQTRTNGQLTVQWKPMETLTATLDYTYAEFELSRSFSNLSAWFNFDAQQTVFDGAASASPLEYTENLAGSDFSMGAGQDAFVTEDKSIGINLLWDVSDQLTLELDHHDSTAENRADSPFGSEALISTASYTRDRTSGFFENDLPVLNLGLNRPLDPDDMIVTGSVFTNDFHEMDIEQTRFSGKYDFDFGIIKSIDFGVQLTEVNNRTASSTVQRDAWGGVTQPGAISDLLTPASTADNFDQIGGSGDARRQTDFFTYDPAALIARTEALIASGDATFFVPNIPGDCGTGLCASSDFTADRRTTEETEAVYFQMNMATELFDRPVEMRFGLRYEQTDVSSQALSPAYTGINWVGGNELTALQSPIPEFTDLEGDYNSVLPNLDFKVDITDNLVGRLSLSKTMTRPNYEDIQGGLTIQTLVRIDGGDGNRGNPNLDPFESENLDVSFEYYYGEDNYVALGYFRKDVENFIGISSQIENSFNLPHPGLGPLADAARAATGSSDSGTLYSWILANRAGEPGVDAAGGVISGVEGRDPASPFNLTVPVNIQKATMDGWEFVVQHNFGDSGFGVIANATIVDADVGYDDLSLDEQFVLFGLSDSANLVLFYDKNDLAVRFAYNWRDDFLSGTGQDNVGAGPPSYTEDYTQLDMSASYWVNDNFQVFMDVLNITDETTRAYGRSVRQTLSAAQFGTRYNFGLRYKF